MDLAIVVVNWNSAPYLRRLLDSIAPFRRTVAEVVVVDNASSDGSLTVLAGYPWIRVMQHDTNLGFAGGANSVISSTQTRFVLLLNADLEVTQQSVRELYGTAVRSPQAAITCGPLVDPSGTPQTGFQFRALPTPWSVLREVLFLTALRKRLFPTRRQGSWKGDQLPMGIQPAAAYWMLRRRAWNQLGGFDPRFWPAWFEDVDLFKRFSDAGWRTAYCATASATHVGGVSLSSLGSGEFPRIFYSNLLLYLKKHHGPWQPVLWLPVQAGSLIRQWFFPGKERA